MKTEKCGNCKFYDRGAETTREHISGEEMGAYAFEAYCRRYPPARIDEDFSGKMTEADNLSDCYSHPVVCQSSWCGEWAEGI